MKINYGLYFFYILGFFLNTSIIEAQTKLTDEFNFLTITDLTNLQKSYAVKNSGQSIDLFESKNNLYQQITDEMNSEYEHIGQREAERVLQNKATSVTGGLNTIGFNYKRPFIDFSISAERNLAPDLFDDKRWIVTDVFSISIDASKIIGHLSSSKVIDISQQNRAAFVGIVFKRSFTWIHFAPSYEAGLSTHFEKLFLPFSAFSLSRISSMNSNEILLKEDSLTVKGGGLVSAPIYPGLSAVGGVLATFEKLSRVEIISSSSDAGSISHDEFLISSEKVKSKSAGLSVGIQADFLNILRYTLLSYDFTYKLESNYKIYLKFNQQDFKSFGSDSSEAVEIKQVLKNRQADMDVLAPYVISEEKKTARTVQHKYNFLLLGGSKNSKTQQIEIESNKKIKTFFRHYYEKIKYTEDFLSRFFASALFAITNTESSAAKMASDSKKLTIEYDGERNLLGNHEDLNIQENSQNLSLTFSADFMTKKTIGFMGKKYKDRAVFTLERYSGVDPLAVDMIKRDYLVAPFQISGQYQVNIDGIRYLNSLSVNDVFDYLDGLCNEYPKNKFLNFRNLFDNCRRSLQNEYLNYLADLSHNKITTTSLDACDKNSQKFILNPAKQRSYLKNCLASYSFKDSGDWVQIPLWSLKNFATNIVNNTLSKVHYYNLFGVSNVFFYGHFDAMTADGRNFTTSFNEGEFKGLGAVDHYMRLENLRSPASVIIDQ